MRAAASTSSLTLQWCPSPQASSTPPYPEFFTGDRLEECCGYCHLTLPGPSPDLHPVPAWVTAWSSTAAPLWHCLTGQWQSPPHTPSLLHPPTKSEAGCLPSPAPQPPLLPVRSEQRAKRARGALAWDDLSPTSRPRPSGGGHAPPLEWGCRGGYLPVHLCPARGPPPEAHPPPTGSFWPFLLLWPLPTLPFSLSSPG